MRAENNHSIIRRGGACLSSADELLDYCTSLLCRYVFSRGSLPFIKRSLIPFGAIILSQLLNGRDSIIPPNRTQSSWLANLRESPPEPTRCWSLPERLENVWPHDECVYGLERLSGRQDCVGIPHTKGGLSNKYCWGQEQTVVKISALFRCLVLSSQLTLFTVLSVNQHTSQPNMKTQTSDCFTSVRRVH